MLNLLSTFKLDESVFAGLIARDRMASFIAAMPETVPVRLKGDDPLHSRYLDAEMYFQDKVKELRSSKHDEKLKSEMESRLALMRLNIN